MELLPPKTFRVSKAGNLLEECEDCFRVVFPYRMEKLGLTKNNARIALADGASESAFAREWARILTDRFITNPPNICGPVERSLTEWLEPCQEEWNRLVPWERIPWHGEAKTRAGSLATLLGLTIGKGSNRSNTLSWRAIAVGDSCLFIVRGGEMALSFPLEDSSQFNNAPALICSNSNNNGGLWERVSQTSGDCVSGDLIILASDALSQWMLDRAADGGKPWEDLLLLYSDGRLEQWINDSRDRRLIQNDDTSLIIIEVK